MNQIAREEYTRLVSRFGAARRAWKRAAVLSGAVVVIIEGLGTFTVAALADLLFSPSLAGRVAILAAGTGVVAFFVARHIVSPLMRRILNKQLALYLEERNPDFEGSLLAAAEFGAADMPKGRQAEIIDSILHEAVRRAEKFDIRKAIDFSRFRKYGVVAVAGLALYIGAGLLLPQSVGNRFARVFTPWRATPEEVQAKTPAAASNEPIRFTLSRTQGDVLRGSTFELEASLSRTPTEDVVFHFRPRTDASGETWKSLPMKELEKLNTFQGALPDVNEEFEFYISSGSNKTDAYRIGVYDPLTLKSIQITAAYPAYMKLQPAEFRNDQGDIAAPVGSTVTMRIATNRPLQSGEILWEKEAPAAGTVDPAHKDTLVVSFPVKDTAGYRYSLKDVTNQLLSNASAATLTAVVDQPPAVKLLKPGEKFTGNPISEIGFVAEVTDDFGIDSGELVVVRQLEGTATETRLKAEFGTDLSAAAVTSAKASLVLQLETLSPPVQAGEVISCNVEVRDRKGQVAVSELCTIDVIPYAAWAYYFEEPAHSGDHVQYFLEPVLAATWALHRTKAGLPPRDFNKQAEEIAATMVDPATGAIVPYFSPLKKTPEQIVHGERAMKFAKDANQALKKHDTAKASRDLQIALAELKLAGYTTLMVVSKPPESQNSASATKFQQEMQRMTALMRQKEPAGSAATKAAQAEVDPAAEAAKAEALRKAQAEIVEKIKKAMEAEKPAKEIEKAAGAQEKNAAEAEKLAGTVKKNAGGNEERNKAGSDLQNAAEAMRDSDAPLKKGDLAKGLAKAETALNHLNAATAKLNASSQDRINQLLAQAAEIAQELRRKQEELVKAGEAKPKAEAIKPLGEKQVKLISRLRDLNEIVDQLQKAAANGALKPETAKHVDEAAREIKRGRVEQKLSNAVVELTAGKADGALPHQTKALESLTKVRDELVAANDARATDVATALKQAKAQAEKLTEKLENLGAKPEAKAAASQAATQSAATQKGAATQTAATQKGAASQAAASQPGRKEDVDKAADAAERLANQLGARDFAKGNKEFQADVNAIKEAVKNRGKLVDELEKVPDAPDKFARLAGRLTHRLEAEILANEQAKRLFESQREECPPEYRQLVNRYFETLSKQDK